MFCEVLRRFAETVICPRDNDQQVSRRSAKTTHPREVDDFDYVTFESDELLRLPPPAIAAPVDPEPSHPWGVKQSDRWLSYYS